MAIISKKLPLRNGVGIVVLNKNNQVFVAKRIDNSKNFWQMPQGGVNKNEDYLAFKNLFFLNIYFITFLIGCNIYYSFYRIY